MTPLRREYTYLVPSKRTRACDNERLSVLGEEQLPEHADTVAKDGNEVRGDVRHRWVCIGVENLGYAMSGDSGDSLKVEVPHR